MLSVVCPFYNEKENLKELYERLRVSLKTIREPWEIIFVNDGSSDGGGDFLKSLIPQNASVRLMELKQRSGMTAALVAGLAESKGDLLATLDADLQNPPEEIPRLLRMLGDLDMVTGIRKERRDSWLRKISSRIANQVRRSVTGDHIIDTGCSLRIFRRKALSVFYPYQGMHRFFLTFAEAAGLKIKQVEVDHAPRKGGLSKYGVHNRLWRGLVDLFVVRWMLSKKIKYQIRGKTE